MPKKVLLLTGKREAPFLEKYILDRNPAIEVISATTKKEFRNVLIEDLTNVRLISFCTGIIVHEEALKRFNLEPYNIHPGPKNYPGICPEAFAIADGADYFGSTAHVMTTKVDAGEIVATKVFKIPKNSSRLDLASLAYNKAVELFAEIANFSIKNDSKMPRTGDIWQGHVNRKEEYEALLKKRPELILDHL